MRMSKHFSRTLRNAPVEAEMPSHQLLLRAGYIRPLAAGIFSYLPLGQRMLTKIENIIREEMNAIGGQEISMPVVHPGEIWKETNRWYEVDVLTRFQDRGGRDMALAVTHEEVVTDLVRREIASYRQLPALIYQFQTKWRDEARPRAGLIRAREFIMKDSYSLDADETGLDQQYRAHYQTYFNIYQRCGVPVIAVAADTGVMGGKVAHEFMYLTPVGEDTLLLCDASGYAANREVAVFTKPAAAPEAPLPLEKVATPGTTTIEALVQYLNIPASKTAKAVLLTATIIQDQQLVEKLVFAVIRGDMEVNQMKLANAVHAIDLRPATEAEIAAVGAVPGYASPIGVRGCIVVVDDAIPTSPNLVAGANETGFHLLNVNYGRDYSADIVTDIAAAREGDLSPDGKGLLREVRGVEVGNIFKLGTRYSEAMGATFSDQDGQSKPVVMGSYGIGLGRLMACVAEEHHDDKGLILPISVAPYHVYLMTIGEGDDIAAAADQLYADFWRAGIEVLYDDRNERSGVKFNDADLIGIPLRIVLSQRTLERGGVEFRQRGTDTTTFISLETLMTFVRSRMAEMYAALAPTPAAMPVE